MRLAVDEIHFWWIDLSTDADFALLSPDEQGRANRLVIPQKRQRFIAGRAALRTILSQYTQLSAQSLSFEYGTDGKPALTNSALHFNLAHSEDRGLLAVALHPIGVDLEHIRPIQSAAYIANTAFTPAEREQLEQYGDSVFFQLWTCKEAAMKAIGGGFRLAQQIEIQLGQNLPPRLVQLADEDIQQWSLAIPPVVPGFTAACVVKQTDIGYKLYNSPD